MSRDTTVIAFRQPDTINDPLTEHHTRKHPPNVHSDTNYQNQHIYHYVQTHEITTYSPPYHTSQPQTTSHHPNQSYSYPNPSHQSTPPTNIKNQKENSIFLHNPTQIHTTNQKPTYTTTNSLPTPSIHPPFPTHTYHTVTQKNTKPITNHNLTTNHKVTNKLPHLTKTQSLHTTIHIHIHK